MHLSSLQYVLKSLVASLPSPRFGLLYAQRSYWRVWCSKLEGVFPPDQLEGVFPPDQLGHVLRLLIRLLVSVLISY
jgi:hypothetical protein